MKAVSVIVPVYNTEAYLRPCLDSLIRSDMFSDCELLLVDDCSQDGSAAVVADYAARFDGIRLLSHDRNRGVSAARNTGLDNASGEYVFFMDSDDILSEDYIGLLYREAKEHDCDLVCSGFSDWKDGKLTPRDRPALRTKKTMTGTEWSRRLADLDDGMNYVWCALYKRSFLEENGLRFNSDVRLYEDVLFVPTVAACAGRVRTVESYAYQYRSRPDSLVGGGVKRRDVDWILHILPILGEDRWSSVGRSLYPVISMCLYYIGKLEEKGQLTPSECAAYREQLRRSIRWKELYSYAATPKEKLKWLLWRLDMRLFYPLVRKNDDD